MHMAQAVGRGESLGFGEGVIEALHIDDDQRGGIVAGRVGGETEAGLADGYAVLRNDEIGGLGGGGRG